jgi:hypothetical protein
MRRRLQRAVQHLERKLELGVRNRQGRAERQPVAAADLPQRLQLSRASHSHAAVFGLG